MDFIIENALKSTRDTGEQAFTVGAPRIVVVGCGGGGNNSVHRLHEMGVSGAEIISINTDKMHLDNRHADKKILIGRELTRGLGAGGYPEVGKKAAEESRQEITEALRNADMVFITAGLGGGTGTGSAPVVAEISKSKGAIVIGVVTMPFQLEKARRLKAESGLFELRKTCDTVIVIENNRLVEVAGKLPLGQAFAVADELISMMIKGIVETIAVPSLMNLDYADVKAVMKDGGVAMIGVGESTGEKKAENALRKALTTPLIDVDYKGGTGALIHITGGPDMSLAEASKIGEGVSQFLDPTASVIWGARVDENMEGRIRVITIITGVKSTCILGANEEKKTKKEVKGQYKDLGLDMI